MRAEYELVMPFVVCQTHGGPYDDKGYAAGFQMGQLDRTLSSHADLAVAEVTQRIRAGNKPQADLIAMRHGYTMKVDAEADGWAHIQLSPAQELDRRDAGERRRDV